MIKKHYLFLAASLLILIAIIGFSAKSNKSRTKDMLRVESGIFRVPGGWGYNILVDRKIFIHQENIPAVSGYRIFTNKEDAEKTAGLVIQKITHQKLPSISVNELDSLHISY